MRQFTEVDLLRLADETYAKFGLRVRVFRTTQAVINDIIVSLTGLQKFTGYQGLAINGAEVVVDNLVPPGMVIGET